MDLEASFDQDSAEDVQMEDVDFEDFLQQLGEEDDHLDIDMLLQSAAGDEAGTLFEYGHLASALPELVVGSGGENDSPPPRTPESSCARGDGTCARASSKGSDDGVRQCSDLSPTPHACAANSQPDPAGHVAVGGQDRISRTKERNRIYAARTRERRNQQSQELRDRCTRLEAENAELRTRLQLLQHENSLLRSSRAGSHDHADAEPCNSTGSAPGRASSLSAGTNKSSAQHGANSSAAEVAAQAPASRAATNAFRFTAAAAGARPPKAAPAGANLTPAQRLLLTGGAAFKGSATSSDAAAKAEPRAACASLNAGPRCGAGTRSACNTRPSAVCEDADPEARVQPCVSSKTSRKRSHADGCVTLGKPESKHGRGMSVRHSRSPVAALATAGVAMLCVVACCVAFTGPGARFSKIGGSDVAPLAQAWQGGAGRSLLSVPDDTTPLYTLSDAVSKDWAAAADAVQDVVPSAEFVCNRSSCFALREGGDAEKCARQMYPLQLRPQDKPAQEAVDMTMMSTLRELAASLDEAGDEKQQDASSHAGAALQRAKGVAPPLRGLGQMQEANAPPVPSLCGPDGCAGFEARADSAMFGAGLISPGTCRLVFDSDASEYANARSAAKQAWSSRWLLSKRGREQVGASGFVLMSDDEAIAAAAAAARGDSGSALVPQDAEGTFSASMDGEADARGADTQDAAGNDTGARSAPVVSVMLPVKREAAEEQGVLTPLRHVYVVVVQPERSLQAYECELSQTLYA